MRAEEAERWGFFNRVTAKGEALAAATELAGVLSSGPTYANSVTKRMLHMEWAMGVDEAVDAEAIASRLREALEPSTRDRVRAAHPTLADGRVGARIADIIAAWRPSIPPRKPGIPV